MRSDNLKFKKIRKEYWIVIVVLLPLVALWCSVWIGFSIVNFSNSKDPEYEAALSLLGSSQQEVRRHLGSPQLNLSFAEAMTLKSGERLFDGYVHIPLRPFHVLEVYRLEPGRLFAKPAIIVFYDSEYKVAHVDSCEAY